ncbi:uncharacterized protein LOC127750923 [Frankliniella occidentalis]|uniref:Uncharacterized protein LOC127750923 n=1 Tax=Frankliniella occidentalis TaxID=133901 RepID=A0A9C6X5R4_FRAOC|nr:uncharacterized protein LOC127750923 [Frankliniella occidentalis]
MIISHNVFHHFSLCWGDFRLPGPWTSNDPDVDSTWASPAVGWGSPSFSLRDTPESFSSSSASRSVSKKRQICLGSQILIDSPLHLPHRLGSRTFFQLLRFSSLLGHRVLRYVTLLPSSLAWLWVFLSLFFLIL